MMGLVLHGVSVVGYITSQQEDSYPCWAEEPFNAQAECSGFSQDAVVPSHSPKTCMFTMKIALSASVSARSGTVETITFSPTLTVSWQTSDPF